MKETVYEVFARKSRGDRLCHVGFVDAFGEETAKVHAWMTYSEERWFEMCVVRREDIVPVNRAAGGYAGERVERSGRGAEHPK